MIVIKNLANSENGQGHVEYSLILSLITIAIIGVVILFGESVFILYETIKEDVTNAL